MNRVRVLVHLGLISSVSSWPQFTWSAYPVVPSPAASKHDTAESAREGRGGS
jgi:hypothetical protein